MGIWLRFSWVFSILQGRALQRRMEKIRRVVTHNFYHWLFVVGTSFVQDTTALAVGVVVLLLALFIFYRPGSDLLKIVIGIPILIVGAAVVLINLYGLAMAFFSHHYSHNRCPFCGSPIQMVDSELKVTCSKCKKEIELSKGK